MHDCADNDNSGHIKQYNSARSRSFYLACNYLDSFQRLLYRRIIMNTRTGIRRCGPPCVRNRCCRQRRTSERTLVTKNRAWSPLHVTLQVCFQRQLWSCGRTTRTFCKTTTEHPALVIGLLVSGTITGVVQQARQQSFRQKPFPLSLSPF